MPTEGFIALVERRHGDSTGAPNEPAPADEAWVELRYDPQVQGRTSPNTSTNVTPVSGVVKAISFAKGGAGTPGRLAEKNQLIFPSSSHTKNARSKIGLGGGETGTERLPKPSIEVPDEAEGR